MLAVGWLAVPARAQEKAADASVIYPRTASPSPAPAAPGRSTTNTLLLVLGLSAAVAGAWLVWRQRQVTIPGGARAERRLSVAETRSLGNRQYLVVADYDGRKFLLGVCPGRIEMLTALDGKHHSGGT